MPSFLGGKYNVGIRRKSVFSTCDVTGVAQQFEFIRSLQAPKNLGKLWSNIRLPTIDKSKSVASVSSASRFRKLNLKLEGSVHIFRSHENYYYHDIGAYGFFKIRLKAQKQRIGKALIAIGGQSSELSARAFSFRRSSRACNASRLQHIRSVQFELASSIEKLKYFDPIWSRQFHQEVRRFRSNSTRAPLHRRTVRA